MPVHAPEKVSENHVPTLAKAVVMEVHTPPAHSATGANTCLIASHACDNPSTSWFHRPAQSMLVNAVTMPFQIPAQSTFLNAVTMEDMIFGMACTIFTMIVGRFVMMDVSSVTPAFMISGNASKRPSTMPVMISGIASTKIGIAAIMPSASPITISSAALIN